MKTIDSLDALDALFDKATPRSIQKVTRAMTPHYRRWIGAARFCILTTVGPEGTDASPRGDDGPVVRIADDHTLWLPDWRGNNRLDSLRNIIRDPRASLLFMVTGSDTVVRVNGTAVLTDDPAVTGAFERDERQPKLVIVLRIGEMYFQCAKALMRSNLWTATPPDLPTPGMFLQEMDERFDADGYDSGYAEYARSRMW
jgi:PPOX class probable FMN-dependent enzyme